MANYIFRAQKMIDRVKAEGRGDMLDEATLKTINSLDGKIGTDYNWQSVVHDENLVWIEEAQMYANKNDCDYYVAEITSLNKTNGQKEAKSIDR